MDKLLTDGVNFGDRLRTLRKRSGLSQHDVEVQLDLRGRTMSRSRYANIEQGKGNLFIIDLILLKDIFKAKYDEFFDGLISQENFTD